MKHTLSLFATPSVVSHPPTLLHSQEALWSVGDNPVETLWVPSSLLCEAGLEARLAFDFLVRVDVRQVLVVGRKPAAPRGLGRTETLGEVGRALEWRCREGLRLAFVRHVDSPPLLSLAASGASDVFERVHATASGTCVRTVADLDDPDARVRSEPWAERTARLCHSLLAPLTPDFARPAVRELEAATVSSELAESLRTRSEPCGDVPRAIECDAVVERADGSLEPLRWARGRRSARVLPARAVRRRWGAHGI